MRGLAKDPAERFPSAASLVTALAEALDISIPKIPSPSINATNTTSSPANSNPARPGLSPSSTTSTGTLPSHSAGQPGHPDHAIHAMNGQTNHKTKLSVAAFALRSHAPSPETALPSNPAGESAPQFATAVSSGQVDEAPGSDSSEESALAHSTPSSLSTAPASLPPTPLALASHCNGNHLCPNMNVEMSFSQLGCERSISSRQDDAQATTVREKDTAETSRLYKSQPCRRVKEYSYGSRA